MVEFKPGERAWWRGQEITIKATVSLDTILVTAADGCPMTVPISELTAAPPSKELVVSKPRDLAEVDAKDWKEATRRAGLIAKLEDFGIPGGDAVQEVADELGVSRVSVYKMLKRWREGGRVVSALLPRRSGPKTGTQRISDEQRAIINSAIDYVLENHPRARMAKIVAEAKARFFNVGIKAPSPTTIRNVFRSRDRKIVVRATRGAKFAKDTLSPAAGAFPETLYPLHTVQIDHTVVDVMVVDEVQRMPIQRPWLTLAIDVHTRMITGFLLSLDPPSSASVALCLSHSVLPKDEWLTRRELFEVTWPVWGKPSTIHVDNGKDFRAEPLKMGASEHQIHIDFRPVRTPRYGGHIERLIGTMMGDVHMLPGTTFSNIREKAEYNPEKTACMTLPELERWLTLNMGVYHNRKHTALGVPPLSAWEAGILGTDEKPGRGLPPRITQPEQFLMDFLPIERRTVQRQGVRLLNIWYWSDALVPHIGSDEHFIVRYDPRNLSPIWIRIGTDYYPLGFRTRYRPPISLWEHREAVRRLNDEGRRAVDESAIFGMIEKMRRIVEAAAATTKSARRASERRRNTENIDKEARGKKASDTSATGRVPGLSLPAQEIQEPTPFEVEEW